MRTRHVATFAVLTGGLTAAAALHRRAGRRSPAPAEIAAPAAEIAAPAAEVSTPLPRPQLVPAVEGVVLPFVRPAVPAPAPERPAAPVRCGDSGGRTKAGAPCAARATEAGRCHHHRVAA